jgi:DNA-binding SARP family transcriptional activator/TolB-like protein
MRWSPEPGVNQGVSRALTRSSLVPSPSLSPSFSLFTLGELRLVGPAGPVLAGRRKELVLLTYLARRAPKAVSRDELAALLWGERDEDKARQSLRHALHQLRRAIAGIEVTNEHVRVPEAMVEVDASLLERDVADGRLADGVERWAGEFLRGAEDTGGETYRAWLEREREAIRRTAVAAFARLVDQARDESRVDQEVHWARRWTEHFPHDDAAHLRLVDALNRHGDTDDARSVHAAFVARLRDEMDLTPSADLIRLGDQISRATAPERNRRRGSGAILAPDLVGRGAAIAASLAESWSRVRGEGCVVAIEGDEGTGKTRLCTDLVRRARADGQRVVVLQPRSEDGDQSSWSTIRRLMHTLIGSPAIEDASARALAELSGVLPALRERFPQLAEPSGQPERVEASLRDVLRVVGSSAPVLVIIDDFGRADTESKRLLRSVITAVPRGTMLVLTLRSDVAFDVEAASDLGEVDGVRRFKLGPLSKDDVGVMVDSMLDVAPSRRDVLTQRVFDETNGNPARVTALVSTLVENGTLTLNARGLWELAPIAPRKRRWVGATLAAAAVIAAIAVSVPLVRSASVSPNRRVPVDPDSVPRIAVLDLELLSRDTADAYLASGLAEEINASLSRFDDLRIKSRGAVRTARAAGVIDPVELGKSLRVDYLVEGNVRRVDQRFKVGVRLTKTSDGFQVWSDDFDAATAALPSLHDRIAREVASRIGSHPTNGQLGVSRRAPTADAQAYEYYLRGNYYIARRTRPTVEQAIAQYRLAMARDPQFAAAHARIAYAYGVLVDWGWPHAGRSSDDLLHEGLSLVQTALELDSLSADAWTARAYLLELADPVRMRGAAEAFERAIALDPRNVEAIHQYAQVHEALGNWEPALAAFRRTLLLEPDRSLPYVAMASIEWKRGAPKEARKLYDSALAVDPGASYALSARAVLRIFDGDVKGGLEDAETAVRIEDGYSIPPHAVLAIALAKSGSQVRAELEVDRALSEVVDPSAPSPTDARFIASGLLAVGRRDEALSFLDRARPRGAWLWFYCLAPDFDSVRTDPRFVRVMREAKPD